FCLKEFVDFYLAARIDCYARSFQMKLISVGLSADCINERIAKYLLAAFQFRENIIVGGINPNSRHFFPKAKRDTQLAQVVGQGFEYLCFTESQDDGRWHVHSTT